MQTLELANTALEKQIKELNEILKEVKYNQEEEIMLLKKNHATNMKKLDKLQEYSKIADMTNQLFEKRLLGMEDAIKRINQSINI